MSISLWGSPSNDWAVGRPRVVTLSEFEAMRVVSDIPTGIAAPPYTVCRALIRGRWHAVSRQYSCGFAYYPASPITIRLSVRDAL